MVLICHPNDNVILRFSATEFLETYHKYQEMGADNPQGRPYNANHAGMAFDLSTGEILPFSMYRIVTEDPIPLIKAHPLYVAPENVRAFLEESEAVYPDALHAAPLSGSDCVILNGLDGTLTQVAEQCRAFQHEPTVDRAVLNGIPMGPIAAYFRKAFDLPRLVTDGTRIDVTFPQGLTTIPPKEAARTLGSFFAKTITQLERQQNMASAPARGQQPTPE